MSKECLYEFTRSIIEDNNVDVEKEHIKDLTTFLLYMERNYNAKCYYELKPTTELIFNYIIFECKIIEFEFYDINEMDDFIRCEFSNTLKKGGIQVD